MTEAFITPHVLRWARERSFPSIAAAARKLNVTVEKLKAWEQGDQRPTFRQAQEAAKRLRVPFGYLYLATPPSETLPLPDLRTKYAAVPRKPSPDFLETMYDALRKQEWYREYLVTEHADNVPFVGRLASAPVTAIAEDIRRTLGLDDALRRHSKDMGDFFAQLVRRAEDARVLVMRRGVVGSNTRRPLSPDEFQGFAISDSVAPLVFVNTNDFRAAQIFTFAHELAHIWIGDSGVCDVEYLASPRDIRNGSTKEDAVAAEVLVPKDTFELRWDKYKPIDQNLDNLSNYYRVSMFVILRRAHELFQITDDVYSAKYTELSQKVRQRKKGGGGRGYSTVFSRNSPTIATALLFSFLEGRVSPKETSVLLNVRASALHGLAQYAALRERRRA